MLESQKDAKVHVCRKNVEGVSFPAITGATKLLRESEN